MSHASADAKAGWIDALEQELQLRGVAVWRDTHQLLAGHHNWAEIERAIDTCTVFVIVVTPLSLQRPAVWDELRRANKRWEADPSFPMIPVRVGVSREELNEHCRMKGVHRLSDQQDIEITVDPAWTPAADVGWAARTARQVLASAIDRHLRTTDGPLAVAVRTRTERTLVRPDLDLDWAVCFDPEPDAATWARLLVALEDLADAIKIQTRQERFSAQLLARIGVGVALGWAVPRTSARKIDIVHADARGTWQSDAAAEDDGNTRYVATDNADGDPRLGTVLLSVGRDAHAMYERSASVASAGYLFEVSRPEQYPMNASTAAAAALAVGRTIRRWCDTQGVTKVQLMGAMPIGLAVQIGRQLNATVDVSVFHDHGGVYVEACLLRAGTKGAGSAGLGVEP